MCLSWSILQGAGKLGRQRAKVIWTCHVLIGDARSSSQGCQLTERFLAVPQVRRADGRHREIHCCRDPTPLSTSPAHGCRMTRPATSRNRCMPRRAQSLCALPFYKPGFSSFSSLCSPPVLRFTQPNGISRCLPCSATPPRRNSTLLLRP